MVRFALKYNLERKQYEWTCKEAQKHGVLEIETNRGVVTLNNYPEQKLVTTVSPDQLYFTTGKILFGYNPVYNINLTLAGVAKAFGFNTVKAIETFKNHVLPIPFMWYVPELRQVFNPVRREWVYFDGDQSLSGEAMWNSIEHDLIEYVLKATPRLDLMTMENEAERADVERTFCEVATGVESSVKRSKLSK